MIHRRCAVQSLLAYIIAINIVKAWEECCFASDYCCTTPKGSDTGEFHNPRKTDEMFASCYIQGDKVTAHDCPAGWAHDGNQCSFVPSSWNRRENGNEAKILTVKSCAASYRCPSPEAVCGKPRVRYGLHLMVNCVLQGPGIDTCPAGWKAQYRGFMKQCIKHIDADYCGNSVGISCTNNSTLNCTADHRDLEDDNDLVLAIFAIPISIFVLIICLIVVKVRSVLKRKAMAQNVTPSNELPPIATQVQSQPMQIQGNILQQNHNQPIQIQNTNSKCIIDQ